MIDTAAGYCNSFCRTIRNVSSCSEQENFSSGEIWCHKQCIFVCFCCHVCFSDDQEDGSSF